MINISFWKMMHHGVYHGKGKIHNSNLLFFFADTINSNFDSFELIIIMQSVIRTNKKKKTLTLSSFKFESHFRIFDTHLHHIIIILLLENHFEKYVAINKYYSEISWIFLESDSWILLLIKSIFFFFFFSYDNENIDEIMQIEFPVHRQLIQWLKLFGVRLHVLR